MLSELSVTELAQALHLHHGRLHGKNEQALPMLHLYYKYYEPPLYLYNPPDQQSAIFL